MTCVQTHITLGAESRGDALCLNFHLHQLRAMAYRILERAGPQCELCAISYDCPYSKEKNNMRGKYFIDFTY